MSGLSFLRILSFLLALGLFCPPAFAVDKIEVKLVKYKAHVYLSVGESPPRSFASRSSR